MVERRCDRLAMGVRSLLTKTVGANSMVEVVLIIVVAALLAGVLWKAFFSSNGAWLKELSHGVAPFPYSRSILDTVTASSIPRAH